VAATLLNTNRAPASAETVVVPKHHWLVRWTHWANIPLLLGMGLSGLSIYWAAPVYKHLADANGNEDSLADIGLWVARHEPWRHSYGPSDSWVAGTHYSTTWFYDHFSLGTGMLAEALNIQWLFAYLFMLNGLLYLVGLGLGGGYKSLLPRPTDLRDAVKMQIYYMGLPFAKLAKRPWPHPVITTKYNALQRMAYFSMPVMGSLSVLTGWAIHKPQQLGWLQGLFGGYDYTRVWHFWLTWIFAAFVIPHVLLVFADGWDTFRSMVVGWSDRVPKSGHEAPHE
jgi:thiosulfate reductase cytochrome b subunit